MAFNLRCIWRRLVRFSQLVSLMQVTAALAWALICSNSWRPTHFQVKWSPIYAVHIFVQYFTACYHVFGLLLSLSMVHSNNSQSTFSLLIFSSRMVIYDRNRFREWTVLYILIVWLHCQTRRLVEKANTGRLITSILQMTTQIKKQNNTSNSLVFRVFQFEK